MKKLRKSPIVIALYAIAAAGLIYTFYVIGSAASYIQSYYSSYGMSAGGGEIFKYVLQNALNPFMTSAVLFAAAYILNEVRALNPAYYATEQEIKESKEAKKDAKIKAKDKVKEKAKEKAAMPNIEKSVEANFSKDDGEIEATEEKAIEEKVIEEKAEEMKIEETEVFEAEVTEKEKEKTSPVRKSLRIRLKKRRRRNLKKRKRLPKIKPRKRNQKIYKVQ